MSVTSGVPFMVRSSVVKWMPYRLCIGAYLDWTAPVHVSRAAPFRRSCTARGSNRYIRRRARIPLFNREQRPVALSEALSPHRQMGIRPPIKSSTVPTFIALPAQSNGNHRPWSWLVSCSRHQHETHYTEVSDL